MPADFEKAVKAGAKVRTVKGPSKQFGLRANEYMHVAFMGGKMFRGEMKKESAAVKMMEKHMKEKK